MAGRGGFNPYRDRNGEFCAPAQAGKPGRSRALSASQNWQGGKSKAGIPGGTGASLRRGAALGGAAARADARAQARAATLTPRQRAARARRAQG
ncbi:hypothetical protein K2Z83_13400 [Oscillochloris sp. ZM17-4]|uniref:hypothetical protein n=1 Tax=Oscillochloris sp. ZM17-4 TaxID=2866714 RepID=UPI001C73C57C|nr:hypothetical protein [Oscillochloris sp. ZM17-4]MBX0328672.1 hypothetical protein [Oscillochloris sp. ZM17-4]